MAVKGRFPGGLISCCVAFAERVDRRRADL